MNTVKSILIALFFLISSLLIAQKNSSSSSAPPAYPVADSLLNLFYQNSEVAKKWALLKEISVYYTDNQPDSALYYSQKTLAFAEKEIPEMISRSYVTLGNYYTEYKLHEQALEVLDKAVELAEAEHCLDCKMEALNELFLLWYDKMEFDKALGFLRQNYQTAGRLEDSLQMARAMTNMSLVFSQIPQNDSAEIYARKAIDLGKRIKANRIIRFCYNNLGIIHQNLGEHEAAKADFKEALHYSRLGSDREMIATALFNVGECHILLNELDTGVIYLNQARDLFEELDRRDLIAYYYRDMAEVYEMKGDYKQALENHKIMVEILDSIEIAIYDQNIAEAETKFLTKEKEVELAKKQLELDRQDVLRNRIIAASLFLLLLVVALFQYFRNKDRLKKKEAELAAQLERAEAEKLREMDQLKSRFFANISHEFRTPLTLIKGPLQAAEKNLDIYKTREVTIPAKYIRVMRLNADRLLRLVNQLLDLSKLEGGKMHLRAAEGDLGHFVRVVAASFESLADRKQINYRIDLPADPLIAWFDPDKLEKILINLLSNAFKFTKEEGEVSVALEETKASEVRIKVSDSGVGISEEELPHIFERFYSSFSPGFSGRRSGIEAGGAGVGLALTKELVELQHGRISVDSKEGEGTTFIVYLPLGKDHLQAEEMVAAFGVGVKTSVESRAGTFSPKRVPESNSDSSSPLENSNLPIALVVEDNTEVREYILDQLGEGYQLLEAVDGQEGLKKALEKIPDLIISDVMMPEMDGMELCAKIKTDERTSHIPFILLTARAEHADKMTGLEIGADDYLAKPFDADELRVRVRNLIEQSRRLRERFETKVFRLQPKEIAVSSADEVFLRRVMEAVEDNMEDEEFSVEELGRIVGMSRYQLHRKLKALTNKSVSVFIRTIRLERARQLLAQGAGNATEICYWVGFSSPAYFSKCFRDQFAMTPSEVYRK